MTDSARSADRNRPGPQRRSRYASGDGAPGLRDSAGDVLGWGLARLRDLPWRRTRDPWSVWTAEVMLQQTQVDRVVPKWEALLAAYPRPSVLADAPLGDVLRLWQGLGYPRRARNLHDAAMIVAGRHGDDVPDDLDELVALPGVGPYTARAILAFAYERDVGVVDTNIARVLARTAGARLTARQAQHLADASVPRKEGWAWNQVMMDLGATVCRPAPRCDTCPLAGVCAWRLAGHPWPDPADGSAHVSTTQAPYEGSDRQARGRALRHVAAGPITRAELEAVVAAHIVDGLVADRLLVEDASGAIDLP